MSRKNSNRLLAVAAIWLVIVGAGVGVWKFVIAPRQESDLLGRTSEPARTDLERIPLALDAFSGYSILRSELMREELELLGLELELLDDGADYGRRIRALERGEVELAVFTIDALIAASAELGELPGTIVMIVDVSAGADAVVAYQKDVPPIDALNRPDARILVTTDSPSETLVRIIRSDFHLPQLTDDCLVMESGPETIFRKLESDSKALPRAYALWEPFVSRALQLPGVVRVTDSSRVPGFIVDVLVARRRFLEEHGDRVEQVIQAYLRAYYEVRRSAGMAELVRRDGDLSVADAASVVGGIRWKNTTENYAHFGLLPAAESRGLEPLDRMIRKITRLLVRSGAIDSDPTAGQPNLLYYAGCFRTLQQERFHPGTGATGAAEAIAADGELRELSDDEWARLLPVGTLQVERIGFARGSSRLTSTGELTLQQLEETLDAYPNYYLLIQGHASARGDLEANRRLAAARAEGVKAFLLAQGVSTKRLRARGEEPRAGVGQHSVTFLLAELPY